MNSSDSELMATLRQIKKEGELSSDSSEASRPFDRSTDISADAKYLWRNIFIWFWALPVGAAIIYLIATKAK